MSCHPCPTPQVHTGGLLFYCYVITQAAFTGCRGWLQRRCPSVAGWLPSPSWHLAQARPPGGPPPEANDTSRPGVGCSGPPGPRGSPRALPTQRRAVGEVGWGLNTVGPGQPLPSQESTKPQTPATHHAPGPLVHNLDQAKIQLSHKFLHCLVQATGHLHLTDPLGHSPDTFHPLQVGRRGSALPSYSRKETQIKEETVPALRGTCRAGWGTWGIHGVGDWKCHGRGWDGGGRPLPV